MKRKLYPVFIILVLLNMSCSVQNYAMKKITSSLAGGNPAVFTGDDDPELIGDALPFTIKMYETLLSKDSSNPELFLSTGKLLCLYSQGYVLFPSDTLPDSLKAAKKSAAKRAKKLFLRGRNYVLKGIELKHHGFSALLNSSKPDSALKMTTAADTAYLYWAGVSWMGAIASDRSDLGLGMTTKKALLFLNRLSSLNDKFNNGSLDEFYCTFYGTAPKSFGGDTSLARKHLDNAISLSKNARASVYVAGATSLSIKSKNRDEFVNLLEKATSIDINEFPAEKLQNTIYKGRAKWLLDNIDHFFLEPKAPEESLPAAN